MELRLNQWTHQIAHHLLTKRAKVRSSNFRAQVLTTIHKRQNQYANQVYPNLSLLDIYPFIYALKK